MKTLSRAELENLSSEELANRVSHYLPHLDKEDQVYFVWIIESFFFHKVSSRGDVGVK